MLVAGNQPQIESPEEADASVSASSAVHMAAVQGSEVNCHSACGGTHNKPLLYTGHRNIGW